MNKTGEVRKLISLRGITLSINGDTTGLDKALKGVNSTIKTVNSSLKEVERLLKLDPTNTELLRQKQQYLAKAVQETKEKLEIEKEALRQAAEQDIPADKMEALKREVIATTQELERLQTEQKKAASVLGSQMQAVGEKLETAGKKISDVGGTLTRTVTAPIVGLGTAAVAVAADFETSMSQVQATLGITKDATTELNGETVNTMETLESLARQLGADTKFSAAEAADAINNLAMAGYSVDEIYEAVPDVLNLAAAGNLSLDDAARMVTNTLGAMGMKTEEAAHLTDVLAKTSSSADGSVQEFGDAMMTVGGEAQLCSQDLNTTATALGILGNNSLHGSEAGTMLRNVMKNLYTLTDKAADAMLSLGLETSDAEGNMKPLNEVLKDLDGSLAGMSEADRARILADIFDSRTLVGAQYLLANCGEEWDNLSESIRDCDGAAQAMSETQQDNLAGQLTILKSQLSELAISLGKVIIPVIRKVVSAVQKFVDRLNRMSFWMAGIW